MVKPRHSYSRVKDESRVLCFAVTCKTTPPTDIGGFVIFMERWEALNHITQDFLKINIHFAL